MMIKLFHNPECIVSVVVILFVLGTFALQHTLHNEWLRTKSAPEVSFIWQMNAMKQKNLLRNLRKESRKQKLEFNLKYMDHHQILCHLYCTSKV